MQKLEIILVGMQTNVAMSQLGTQSILCVPAGYVAAGSLMGQKADLSFALSKYVLGQIIH